MQEFEFDVSPSFSGVQRDYVRAVVERLRHSGARIFYDEDFTVEIWGEDINEYLRQVYGRSSRFIVMFVSKDYAETAFPTVERREAFAAEMHRDARVLPVRFDDTDLPGLGENIAYLNGNTMSPDSVADAIILKLQQAGVQVFKPSASSFSPRPRKGSSETVSIRVRNSEGKPISDAQVAGALANGVIALGVPREPGAFHLTLPKAGHFRLWVAHSGYRALHLADFDPESDGDVEMGTAAGVGSAIFSGSTGHLPPIPGRFNPHINDAGGGYVYIDNAAVNGRPATPAPFTLGQPFEVEDISGDITVVTIADSTGHGSLLEYETPT